MLRRMFGAAAMAAVCLAGVLGGLTPAFAGLGQPTDGQMGLQLPATQLMEQLITLYDVVNLVIIAIALFVLFLMLYVMYRFSEKKNPTPSRTTHNVVLEVAWTVIPILILAGISIPSFRLLYDQYSFPKPDITVKAVANAWYWDHEYLDSKFTVSSNYVSDEDVLKQKMGDDPFAEKYGALEGIERSKALYQDAAAVWAERSQLRKLTVDNDIALPVNKVVHLLVTSNDVIHSWTIPSFGVKMQAVPGRTAALWFKPDKVGTFHGQCSVLCGKLHSAMPITVRVVEQAVYDQWVAALTAKDRKKANEILKADAERSKANPAVAQVETTQSQP
ncbi:MAG: cytochrome c oxidase subunit II [Hyphomicrobium sp.]|nr:MAG: cytochrome c oxidase subunit II [Hyphomicrobium sp.]